MGTMNSSDKAVVKAPKVESHKLQASNERHPASYYDKTSSHYQGGIHNVLLNKAKESMAGIKPVKENQGNHGHNAILSIAKKSMSGEVQSSLGGSHNVAMNILM